QNRIRLEDHETVVIREVDGSYSFRHGTDEMRSFFLEPHTELVSFWWSSGLTKDARNLNITKLDRRPKFMWYDFEVRTKDNVELIIGITFFWQVNEVEKMVATTDDTTGDVCAHSRSMIIQSVSRVTLEAFLDGFNNIVHDAVIDTDDPFYEERGTVIHAVEVRAIRCKDAGTQQILNEIIQETTDRLNRLQKQESENEVRLRYIEGEIAAEQQRGDLLELQRQAKRIEALAAGEAEAERVRAFFAGLADLPEAGRQTIWETLRKRDALEAVTQGDAQVFFTPSDVNLSIETA
ncbi:MAG: SPFH domain-containing protein, partial [Chloroflexota bacterium]